MLSLFSRYLNIIVWVLDIFHYFRLANIIELKRQNLMLNYVYTY